MHKLLAVFGVLILLLCAGVFVVGYSLTALSETNSADQQKAAVSLAKLIEDDQIAFAGKAVRAAESIARDPGNRSFIEGELSRMYVSSPLIESLFFVNATNHIVALSSKDLTAYLGKEVPQISTNPPGSDLYTIVVSTDTHAPLVPAKITPVRTPEGIYVGSIVSCLDVGGVTTTIESQFPKNPAWRYWLIGGSGTIFVSPEPDLAGANIYSIDSPDKAGFVRAYDRVLATESGTAVYTAYSYGKLKLSDYQIAWGTITTAPAANTSTKVIVASTLSSRTTNTIPFTSAEKTLEEFVNYAAEYAVQHGREAAVAAFNNQSGPFITKEYYITAFDVNGTLLAHSYLLESDNPDVSHPDKFGVKARELIQNRAAQGGGYVIYLYANPTEDFAEQLKLTYIVPVDENWFVLAGEYLPAPIHLEPSKKEELVQYLRSVQQFAQSVEQKDAIRVLGDPTAPYYPVNMTFFGMDTTGTILVDPLYPKFVGKNYMSMTDAYGSSITRDAIYLAGRGGGLQYEYVPVEYDKKKFELRLEYVLPVDNDWFLVASIPVY